MDLVQREIHPIVQAQGAPDFFKIFRFAQGIPQYLMGHGMRLKPIEHAEEEYPGLVFAGNAYRGIGLNDCVVSAHRAVEKIIGKRGGDTKEEGRSEKEERHRETRG